MIKSLLDFENEPKVTKESAVVETAAGDEPAPVPAEPVNAFEVPAESRFFRDENETELPVFTPEYDDEPTSELLGGTEPIAIYETIRTDTVQPNHAAAVAPVQEIAGESAPESPDSAGVSEETALVLAMPAAEEKSSAGKSDENDFIFSHAAPKPVEPFDAVRARGLAFSAGIAVIGSVTFLMLLGWFADLLLGTKPWGVVGGIIIGGILGFVQLFRIAAQIFRR